MLSQVNLLVLCSLVLYICVSNGQVATARDISSLQSQQISARTNPRRLNSAIIDRRQAKSSNNTLSSYGNDEPLQITCFRNSEELKLQDVKIDDCALIIADLEENPQPHRDRRWGTRLSKSPDYVIPLTLPRHGSCIAKIEPWPPSSVYAVDEFSPTDLAFAISDIILACLTGDDPVGGSMMVGPLKFLRLTLSGPLPLPEIAEDYLAIGQNKTVNGLPQAATFATS